MQGLAHIQTHLIQAARDTGTVNVGNAPYDMHVASRDHMYMPVGIAWNALVEHLFKWPCFHQSPIARSTIFFYGRPLLTQHPLECLATNSIPLLLIAHSGTMPARPVWRF